MMPFGKLAWRAEEDTGVARGIPKTMPDQEIRFPRTLTESSEHPGSALDHGEPCSSRALPGHVLARRGLMRKRADEVPDTLVKQNENLARVCSIPLDRLDVRSHLLGELCHHHHRRSKQQHARTLQTTTPHKNREPPKQRDAAAW